MGVKVTEESLVLFGRFEAPAHDKIDVILIMGVFFVKAYSGEVIDRNEIEECQRLDYLSVDDVAISTIFRNNVFPQLVERGLVK